MRYGWCKVAYFAPNISNTDPSKPCQSKEGRFIEILVLIALVNSYTLHNELMLRYEYENDRRKLNKEIERRSRKSRRSYRFDATKEYARKTFLERLAAQLADRSKAAQPTRQKRGR